MFISHLVKNNTSITVCYKLTIECYSILFLKSIKSKQLMPGNNEIMIVPSGSWESAESWEVILQVILIRGGATVTLINSAISMWLSWLKWKQPGRRCYPATTQTGPNALVGRVQVPKGFVANVECLWTANQPTCTRIGPRNTSMKKYSTISTQNNPNIKKTKRFDQID